MLVASLLALAQCRIPSSSLRLTSSVPNTLVVDPSKFLFMPWSATTFNLKVTSPTSTVKAAKVAIAC